MYDPIIARKYATALFRAALNAGALDAVAGDIESLSDVLVENPAFVKFLSSPQEGPDRKHALLKKLFEHRMAPTTFNFLNVVVEKKRTGHLPEIADEFQELVRQHRGIVKAVVTTAVPLDGEQTGRLKTELDRLTGRTVQIESRVDPQVL